MFGLKNIRLPGYNYHTTGYYFVTINANWKQNIFLGKEKVIKRILIQSLGEIHGARLDTYNIRSNHIHCIIVLDQCLLPLGEIIRRFKARVSRALKIRAWQPNYYEHIIRSEESLGHIRSYIIHQRESEIRKSNPSQ